MKSETSKQSTEFGGGMWGIILKRISLEWELYQGRYYDDCYDDDVSIFPKFNIYILMGDELLFFKLH